MFKFFLLLLLSELHNIQYKHNSCRLYLSQIVCVLPVSAHSFDCWYGIGNNMKKILVLVSTSEFGNFYKIWREVVIWFYWYNENLFCLDSQKAWNLNRNMIQVYMCMKRLAQKVTYCEKCKLQNKFFGHEDVSGIEILDVRISRRKVTEKCESWCSDGGENECCCLLLKVPAVIQSVGYFETSVHEYQTTLIHILKDSILFTIGMFISVKRK